MLPSVLWWILGLLLLWSPGGECGISGVTTQQPQPSSWGQAASQGAAGALENWFYAEYNARSQATTEQPGVGSGGLAQPEVSYTRAAAESPEQGGQIPNQLLLVSQAAGGPTTCLWAVPA